MGSAQWREVLVDLLRQEEPIGLAILFGSEARGGARAGSDIDVAVDAPSDVCLDLAARLTSALEREVDVLSLDAVTIPLLDELVASAKLLFERSPGRFVRWRTRAILDLETDRPWFMRMSEAQLRNLRGARRGA